MSMTKPDVGWWLPDPRNAGENQARRMKFFVGWVVRLAVVVSVCFGATLYYNAKNISFMGAAAATGLFMSGLAIVITVVTAVVWNDDLRRRGD